jgi:general secretion pathway protein D
VKELIDPLTIKRLYRSAIDSDDNLLIVTAPENIHERIKWLREEMDVEGKRPGSSVKFYKLKNANAEEVLQTLMSIQQTGTYGYESITAVSHIRGVSPLGRGPTGTAGYSMGEPASSQFVPGPNYPETPAQPDPTLPPAYVSEERPGSSPAGQPPSAPGEMPFLPESARVTADPFTNSIIVVGDRTAQEVYKDVIEYLDRKRPQVLIEARVVIIDTSNDFSLGVELSGGDREGVDRLFQFTSYGLSTVNPATGALALIPGRGLNATLVDAEDADYVVRALSTNRRAKVISAPRVLVNDNATGTLASVTEVPFTSVNASNTVATTSFAGFAEAGTTIEVTPRISDGDHLLLDYVVTLNSFTGTGSDGVPPPRQTDEVRSTVTIPDGSTVIVGGLNRYNTSWNYDGIPFIEYIPIVRTLTGITDTSKSRTTLFVFLKPVILRDDKFRELRYLSDKDLNCAGCKQNFPISQPMLVK